MPYRQLTHHQRMKAARKKNRSHADRRRRREYFQRLYYTARWARFRQTILKAHPMCLRCEERMRVRASTEVHHIIPVRERPDLAYDPANCEALCKPCHSKHTATEQRKA